MQIYFRLLKYIKPYIAIIIGGIACMLVVSVTNIAVVPLVGKLSEAIGGKDQGMLNHFVLLAIGVFFIKGLFTYGQMYLLALVGQKIIKDIRVQVFEHIQDLSLDFFARWRTGDIMSRILGDINIMQTSMVSSVTSLFPNLLSVFGILGYLLYLNWRLTLISLVAMPIISFMVSYFGRQIRMVSLSIQKKAADISAVLQENIAGIRVVKSFTMEKHEVERFKNESELSLQLSILENAMTATQAPLVAFIQVLAVLLLIWYGGFEVVSGRLAASSLIAFFAGTMLLTEPLNSITNLNALIQRSIAAAIRVFEVIDIKATVKERPDAVDIHPVSGSVEFKNVSFHYESGQAHVLNNINVRVSPGEIIALVGPSGAGKSTFINLIPRFWDPIEGSISIDGHDIRELKILSFRKHIGIVPQDTLLFSGTIKDNIAYGKTGATQEDIVRAAKMANAHDFIMALPKGYDALVGEKGYKLSGGERQRIAVARALLRDPRILILDEATSSLDAASERLVQDALEKLMKGRTTFVIAHRLSTVMFADRILVLEKGRIVEEGKHEDLLKHGGLYKKLYDMQFRDRPENTSPIS